MWKVRKSLQRGFPRASSALSILFDREWYLEQNPDVRTSGIDPLRHYLQSGAREGRDPHPLFDSDWYLEQNPDVREGGVNPLVHYLELGWRESRDPSVLFSLKDFIRACPEAAATGSDPLIYYLSNWRECGSKLPVPVFRRDWYIEQYLDAKNLAMDPLVHYLKVGAAEGKNPNPLFESKWYAHTNPDVAALKENPLVHYLRRGAAEGRPANTLIKGRWYIEDIDESGVPGGLKWVHVPTGSVGGRGEFDTLAHGSTAERFSSEEFSQALTSAASKRRHLLFVHGGAFPKPGDVQKLVSVFDADPMIGFVIPRFATSGAGRILPVLKPETGHATSYDRRMLAHLPRLQLTPEFLAPCVLARGSLISNIPDFSEHFESVYGALLATMTWSRRVGYRTAIANEVVVDVEERAAYPELADRESKILIGFFPDSVTASARLRKLSSHRREALLGQSASDVLTQRRLLLDCSGMRPFHNGTSESAIGIIKGLEQVIADWDVDVFVPEDADVFHGLRSWCTKFNIINRLGERDYAVAVRLSQPWSMTDIAGLHGRARYILFMFLDTISWDTIYGTPEDVERTWYFAAAYADGLLYDSSFTMERFNFRFSPAPHVTQTVSHLSFDADEYTARSTDARTARHVLIVGNDHDHKAIEQALATLPSAFPAEQFVVLGSNTASHSNVRAVRSGLRSPDEIESLFAEARMVVYPSFYEGFGLPIIKALSYGLDVVARRSELLYEIAANSSQRGRIVPFDNPASLVDAVRECLAGAAIESLPLGEAREKGGAPTRWRDVAGRILGAIEAVTADAASPVPDLRAAAFRLVDPAALCRSG